MINIEMFTVKNGSTIRNALQSLNKISKSDLSTPLNLFIIDNEDKMIGSLTDGDVRRGLIDGRSLDDSVESIMNKNYQYLLKDDCALSKIREFRELGIGLVPIIDQENKIDSIIDLTKKKSLLPIDSVIMAGGEGKRLRPLTENTPKPLLKVGEKAIIDYIVDRINLYGIPKLTVSVRYKGEQIIDHFKKVGDKWDLDINFVKEDTPLGTIGALSMIDDFKHETILLSNSDLLSTINYEKFYEFFRDSNADVAVASVPYNVKIPYGIFNTNGSEILSLQEKPEYTYYSNAGIYLLKRELISKIPKDEFVDVTDFLEMLIEKDYNVNYYPLFGYWQDVGRHEDFEKVQKDINLIET